MVTRLKIPLIQAEYSALLKIALAELRDPVEQAHFILRQELERQGLLNCEKNQIFDTQDIKHTVKAYQNEIVNSEVKNGN